MVQSYIQVDSRGCGQGKTRDTIIPRVHRNIKNRIRTLIVVPSKNLQHEYAQNFLPDQITVINSDAGHIFKQYQLATTPVVCMTHEGFLRTPNLEKMNWDLIIDEAFMPYSTETFCNFDSAGRVIVDFSQLVSWKDPEVYSLTEKPTVSPQPYFELDFIKSTPASTVNRRLWQKLTNPNLRQWATWEVGTNLMNNARETTTLQLEVSEEVLSGWSSVWIAAAAFNKTFMGMWMASNNIPYETVYKFVKHEAKSIWHCPLDTFSWSKTYREQHPEVEALFKSYCDKNRSGRLIYNSNNDCETVFEFGDRIGHNSHGINGYRDRTDHAFMSAIKPHPQFKNFIVDRAGPDEKELEFAFAGYMAYQLVMRTALRDPDNLIPVNLFFLDTQQMLGVLDMFDVDYYEVRFINEIKGNKSVPLTPSEKQKRYREKQKALKQSKTV